ncbi:trypsin-like peptidase domain-containing protein [Ruminococcaceae bacterium OttesenSCG-928-O06]|nr:trypsin-like peptidase domain-containing protein [Ruminococcaceae bacterium OttesenSCG-928-O06]
MKQTQSETRHAPGRRPKRARGARRWAALALALLLALAMPLGAGAAAVPQQVLDARNGVVRIVTLYPDGFGVGTGFAVGTEDRYYIVTNYHVIEDGDDIRIYYQTGRYVEADIVAQSPGRDIAILRPVRKIRGISILPVVTEDVEVGIAVYALGYPAASDQLAGDWYNYDYDASNIIADKDTMTVTDGIVSAIRDNQWMGDESRVVRTVQTNAAISGGNSGGPLLDERGCVVGINTLSIRDDSGSRVEGMHAAVHAKELVAELRAANIRFEEPDEGYAAPAPVPTTDNRLAIGIAAGAAVLVVCVAVVLLVRTRKKKPPLPRGESLRVFEEGSGRLEEAPAVDMALAFVETLLPLAQYDLNPLLTPDNVYIGQHALALAQEGAPKGTKTEIWPGYTAPEVYAGTAGPAASVYFIGAVLYTLVSGRRPPDAPARPEAGELPVFCTSAALRGLVQHAMQPKAHSRIATLHQLRDALAATRSQMHTESGQGPAPGAWQ